MRVGIIGAGRIGGGIARQLAGAGHEVLLSFSQDPRSLERLAAEIGPSGATGSPAEGAAGFGEVVVISVPWSTLPQAIEQAQKSHCPSVSSCPDLCSDSSYSVASRREGSSGRHSRVSDEHGRFFMFSRPERWSQFFEI